MTYDEMLKNLIDSFPIMEDCEGDGIVICGGGILYFPRAYYTIRILRELGCELPIELWALHNTEMTQHMRKTVEPYDVVCRSARREKARYVKLLDAWKIKASLVTRSTFKRVLYIDAGCAFEEDPTHLFDKLDSALFPTTGEALSLDPVSFVVDADLCEGKELLSPKVFLVDKEKAWDMLNLVEFYHDSINHDDKDRSIFTLAALRTGVYETTEINFTKGKVYIYPPNNTGALEHLQILHELYEDWEWGMDSYPVQKMQMPETQDVVDIITAKLYVMTIDKVSSNIELLSTQFIGEGYSDDLVAWDFNELDLANIKLCLYGRYGVFVELSWEDDGHWRGVSNGKQVDVVPIDYEEDKEAFKRPDMRIPWDELTPRRRRFLEGIAKTDLNPETTAKLKNQRKKYR